MLAQPRLHAAVAPEDLAVRPEAEAVVHVALQVLQEPAEADLRLRRRPARGEGRAQGLRRGAGVQGRAARDPPPLGGEGAAAGVVARVVARAAGARLEAVHLLREAAPEAAEAAQVGDAERELEGDERVVQEEVRLLGAQGLHVVDEGAVVRLRVPEAAGLPARPARARLRDGVVQLARADAAAVPDAATFPDAAAVPGAVVRAAWFRTFAFRVIASDFTAMVVSLLAAAQSSRRAGETQ